MQELRVIPVPLSGDVQPGDSLADKFLDALKRRRLSLAKGDILVVKHKIVSKAEGQLIRLDTIKPSARSRAWARRYMLDARITELALQESKDLARCAPTAPPFDRPKYRGLILLSLWLLVLLIALIAVQLPFTLIRLRVSGSMARMPMEARSARRPASRGSPGGTVAARRSRRSSRT